MKRRYYAGRDVSRALSIEELRHMALRRLPFFVQEYLESGGEDEVSLARNRAVFAGLPFVPKTLVDTTRRTTETTLFGRTLSAPILVAPSGHNGLFWREGDTALASAAHDAGLPYVLSTLSNTRVETLAERTSGPLWMQLYMFQDRTLTDDIVQRAKRAGCEALVLTVDSNVFGWREWDRRQYRRPGQLKLSSMLDVACHPRWAWQVLRHGMPKLANVAEFFPPEARTTRGAVMHVPTMFAPNLSWDIVRQLRQNWDGKLLIKGILCVDDAERAAESGCDGVILSNHGARHLDSCISPMEILPQVHARIGDRLSILIDSGFRRGSDVLKALALGADAVLLGRAAYYGLAAGGKAGVSHALHLMQSEIHRTMGQIGCNSLDELSCEFLAVGPGIGPGPAYPAPACRDRRD